MHLVTPATLTRVWPLVSSQYGRGLDGALDRAQVTVGVDRDLDQVLGAVTHDDGLDSPDAAFTGPGIGRQHLIAHPDLFDRLGASVTAITTWVPGTKLFARLGREQARPSAAVASCTFFEANFSRSLAPSQFLNAAMASPVKPH
ncbi:hypothetical protein [Nonomuraea bangladeshensis]|uniref:hypothetical protein n=1 Tax=Nonomuraea bangladeshensis TaxID=404385 RepID=UPI003C2F69DE